MSSTLYTKAHMLLTAFGCKNTLISCTMTYGITMMTKEYKTKLSRLAMSYHTFQVTLIISQKVWKKYDSVVGCSSLFHIRDSK